MASSGARVTYSRGDLLAIRDAMKDQQQPPSEDSPSRLQFAPAATSATPVSVKKKNREVKIHVPSNQKEAVTEEERRQLAAAKEHFLPQSGPSGFLPLRLDFGMWVPPTADPMSAVEGGKRHHQGSEIASSSSGSAWARGAPKRPALGAHQTASSWASSRCDNVRRPTPPRARWASESEVSATSHQVAMAVLETPEKEKNAQREETMPATEKKKVTKKDSAPAVVDQFHTPRRDDDDDEDATSSDSDDENKDDSERKKRKRKRGGRGKRKNKAEKLARAAAEYEKSGEKEDVTASERRQVATKDDSPGSAKPAPKVSSRPLPPGIVPGREVPPPPSYGEGPQAQQQQMFPPFMQDPFLASQLLATAAVGKRQPYSLSTQDRPKLIESLKATVGYQTWILLKEQNKKVVVLADPDPEAKVPRKEWNATVGRWRDVIHKYELYFRDTLSREEQEVVKMRVPANVRAVFAKPFTPTASPSKEALF